jgi:spoIIIJ-associated protein
MDAEPGRPAPGCNRRKAGRQEETLGTGRFSFNVSDKKYTLAEAKPRIEQFLNRVFPLAGFKLDYIVSEGETPHPDFENPDVLVRFSGLDVDLLLANKAELLLALEQLTMEAMGMPAEEHSRLCFDANDYRILRIEELRMSALAAADRVK